MELTENPDLNKVISYTSAADIHDSHDDFLPSVDPAVANVTVANVATPIGGAATVTAALDLSQTFQLSSLAGANHTIYLDFLGHTTTGTSWNSAYTAGAAIITPAYDFDGNTASFSDAEQTAIQQIYQRVAEDFLPFNVNVTTKAPTDINDLMKTSATDTRWGMRVVIGGSSGGATDWFKSAAGGVAFVSSFSDAIDTPTFVFEDQLANGNEKYTAEAISHEVGHTLGLNHDGRTAPVEGYYSGQGSGETGWAPLMGVGYYQNLSQWSKGEYGAANNLEDDLQIITTKNGFGYRADDAGNIISTAKALTLAGNAVSGGGIIERSTDLDYYSFLTDAGAITLNINPAVRGPNLDILAELYSADGTLVASSNPIDGLGATIATTIATAGSYYLKIDGVGKGDPLTTGYTDYGSLGQYSITGNIVQSTLPLITLALTPTSVVEDGATNLLYTFTRTGDTTNALTVNYQVGGTANSTDDYTQSGATSFTGTTGTITFAAGATTTVLTIDPTADTTLEGSETVAVTLASDPTYLVGTTSAVIGTIVDPQLSVVSVAVAPNSVVEDGVANLLYTFSRTGDTTKALTVNYQLAGTADAATDYTQSGGAVVTSTTGTITFAAGATTALLTIDPTADKAIEGNETVALTLASDPTYVVGTTAPVIGTIVDDDVPVVTLALAPTTVLEDGAINLLYTFSRTGDTTTALTVNYQVAGSASSATDYSQIGGTSFNAATGAGTITFAAGASTATLTVDPTADTVVENNETVAVTLGASSNYTVGTTTAVTGTIIDDERPVVTLEVSPASVLEDGTTNIEYTFTRTGSTAKSLSVQYGIGGTATFNTDYTQTGASMFSSKNRFGTITFAANSTTAKLIIDPKADTVLEKDETVVLTLQKSTSYNLGTSAGVVGTILNDEAGAISSINSRMNQESENIAPVMANASVVANAPTIAASSSVVVAAKIDIVEGLTLNLTQLDAPTAEVTFKVDRSAAYNNSVGFYQVLDASGAIQTSEGIVKTTDAGYLQAALKSSLANALKTGLDLGFDDGEQGNMTVKLNKSFYMPILVADGTLADAAKGQNLHVYTAFAGANADKTEHIRDLGNGTLGFEDTFGGGDRDYNDLTIKASIA